jgi:hypothetical protein
MILENMGDFVTAQPMGICWIMQVVFESTLPLML